MRKRIVAKMFTVLAFWVIIFPFYTFLSKFSAVCAPYFYNVGKDFLMKTSCFDLLLEQASSFRASSHQLAYINSASSILDANWMHRWSLLFSQMVSVLTLFNNKIASLAVLPSFYVPLEAILSVEFCFMFFISPVC